MTDSINFQADRNYEAYEDGKELVVDEKFIGKDEVRKRGLEKRRAQYVDSIMPTLKDLEADFKKASATLQKKISKCDDVAKEQQLKAELDSLEETWRQVTHQPPGNHREMAEFKSMWQERIANTRTAVVNAHNAAQSADSQAIKPMVASIEPPLMQGPQYEFNDELPSSDGTDEASSSESADSEWSQERVDGMITKMHSDPEGFMAELDGIEDPAEQQQAMNMVMQQLQQMNRMFSMMSNMQKAMHDTAKAAINNMRV